MAGRLQTVAFVDVESSTELLTRAGDEKGLDTIERRLDVARERVEPYDGRTVKTLGDGLMLTFDSPRSAVEFSVAVQHALSDRRPRLRIGIHFGEVLGATEDPTGEAVNAAARITDKAAGGEILVSDIVRRLTGSTARLRFVDRGQSRLKGFPDSWQLHEVVAGDAPAPPPPVFGRDEELECIDELLAAIEAGSGRILVAEGEAGIGKTQLARVAGARAAARGTMTLTAGADELEQDRPGRILGPLAEGLGIRFDDERLATDGTGATSTNPSFAVVERFLDALENAASAGPVLLIVEDLQWADELSLRGLAAIARRIAPLPIGLVLTARPAPRSPQLHRLLEICDAADASTLHLSGLDDVGVAGLVASLTGAAPGPSLRQRLASTSGNPLFVTELIRALDDDNALRVEAGVSDTDATGLPDELVRTLIRRINTLPPETVETLRLASLLGSEFALKDLATIAGRSVLEVAAALGDGVDAAIVAGAGEQLAFRHDLIREAIYEELAAPIRTDLHLAAGRSLAAAGAPAQQVARHYKLGAEPPDVDAAEWLTRAGHEVAELNASTAAEWLEHALDLAPAAWPARAETEAALIQLLADSGRIDDALARAESLLDRSLSPEDELVARRAYGSALATVGQLDEATRHLLVAAALPGVDEHDEGALRCGAAGLGVIAGTETPEVAMETARRYLDAHDPTLACWAHNAAAVAAVATARYDDLFEHARRAKHLLQDGDIAPLGFVLVPHAFLATAQYWLGDTDGAFSTVLAARRWAEARGDTALLTHLLTCTVGFETTTGDWDTAASEAEAAITLAAETGDNAQLLYQHATAGLVAWSRGDDASAREQLEAGEALLASGHHLFGLDVLAVVRAKIYADEGNTPAAREELAEVWTRTAGLRGLLQWTLLGPMLVELHLEAGEIDAARRVAQEVGELAERSSSPVAQATLRHCHALLDVDPDGMVEAVDMLGERCWVMQRANAAERAAALLTNQGRTDEAVVMLRIAESIHRTAGATRDLTRVDDALRATGASQRGSRDAKATHGWDALSPKELQVAELVAAGLSNPQIGERLFISRRTVESHVSHVFQKLGLSNRTQLATETITRLSEPPAQAAPPEEEHTLT